MALVILMIPLGGLTQEEDLSARIIALEERIAQLEEQVAWLTAQLSQPLPAFERGLSVVEAHPTRDKPGFLDVFYRVSFQRLSNDFTIEIALVDVVRGEEADEMLRRANAWNVPAPEGKEYLLAKFVVQAVSSARSDVIPLNAYNFKAVTARGLGKKLDPEPMVLGLPSELADVRVGHTVEGWIPFLIDVGETPLLVYLDYIDGGAWFDPAMQ